MKYTSEQIVPQEYIGTYGKSVIDHIQNVLNKNLADAIIENSEQDVVIHFSDFYEQPTEVIPNSISMRRNVTIEPLVRCKDCVYWEQATPDSGNCNRAFEITAYGSDFCSYGERREE